MKIAYFTLLLIIIFFIVSCNKTDKIEYTTEAEISVEISDVITDESEGPETTILTVEPETAAEPTPDDMIQTGLVFSTNDDTTDWVVILDPIAKWYAGNYITGNKKLSELRFIAGRTYPYFDNIILNSAIFLAKYGEDECYFSLLFGSVKGNNNTYYLIDGKISDTYINFKDSWDKIKAHKIIGEYAGELKQTVYTGVMTVLNAGDIIGDDREILYTFSLNDAVAAVSAVRKITKTGLDYPNDYRRYLSELHLDIFNPSDGKKTVDTIVLKDIYEDGYVITGYTNAMWTTKYKSNGKIMFSFGCDNLPGNNSNLGTVYYIVDLDGTEVTSEVFFEYYKISDPSISFEFESIETESGRYKSFYINGDLYIRDNNTRSDVRVFESKPDVDTGNTDINEYISARAAFFDGDTLYYYLIPWEGIIGSGYYNAVTGEKGEFRNGVRIEKKVGDLFYGSTSIYDTELYYGTFCFSDPYNIKKMPFNSEEISQSRIHITDDGTMIKLTKAMYNKSNNYKWSKDISSLTIYNGETMKVNKVCIMESPYEYMDSLVVADGYAWAFTTGGTILITKY